MPHRYLSLVSENSCEYRYLGVSLVRRMRHPPLLVKLGVALGEASRMRIPPSSLAPTPELVAVHGSPLLRRSMKRKRKTYRQLAAMRARRRPCLGECVVALAIVTFPALLLICGGRRIRTPEGIRRQVYSLLPLSARASPHPGSAYGGGCASLVAYGQVATRWSEACRGHLAA